MSAAAISLQTSVRQVLDQASVRLRASDSAALDAQLLLAHALGKSRTWLYAWPEAAVDAAALQGFHGLLEARAAGTPVAYLLGKQEFWSLTLQVSPAVLIPRPDTELLVQTALELGPAGPALVADLGTGSGAIALALASERPQWQLHATDLSDAALAVAGRNREALGLANVRMLSGSWCEPLQAGDYDLILSNPPYIAADDVHLAQGDLRFEPRSALVAHNEGLADIVILAAQALPRLKRAGWLLIEHGWQQGPAVRALLQQDGYVQVQTRLDAGGRERMTMGCKP
jgi:release factor glutamine methyltransferase